MVCVLVVPAVKILSKHHIVKEKKVPYVKREREVLLKINHPFFVKLYFTFQDKENLCILGNLHCIIGHSVRVRVRVCVCVHTHAYTHYTLIAYYTYAHTSIQNTHTYTLSRLCIDVYV